MRKEKARDRESAARHTAREPSVQPPAGTGSASAPASKRPRELGWLIGQGIISIILGLGCFAESGGETLSGYPFFSWLVRGFSVWLLLLGAFMLYTAHRVKQSRPDALPDAKQRIHTYGFVFMASMVLLVALLTVLSLLLRP